MIPKYRNQALLRLGITAVMLVTAIVLMAITYRTQYIKLGQFLGISLIIGAVVLYIFGCTAWAAAKGIPASIPSGIIAASIALLFCIPIVPVLVMFVFLPALLFLMEDQHQRSDAGSLKVRLKQVAGYICLSSAVLFGVCTLGFYVCPDAFHKDISLAAALTLICAVLFGLAWVVLFFVCRAGRKKTRRSR